MEASLSNPTPYAPFILYLVEAGKLSRENQQRLTAACNGSSQPFDVIITQLGLLQDSELSSQISIFLRIPELNSLNLQLDVEAISSIGLPFLKKHCLLPILDEEQKLVIGSADPFNKSAVSSIEFYLDQKARHGVLPRAEIQKKLDAFSDISLETEPTPETLEQNGVSTDDLDRLQDIASEAPVVQFVIQVIQDAVDKRATDIHLEPQQGRLQARCRIDGILHDLTTKPISMHPGILTRIKVLSRLNIAERRRPQDGRMRVSIRGKNIDLRVSIIPTINGEAAVLRILDKSAIPLDLPGLGFDPHACDKLVNLAHSPNGIILATGPTGSGKTTTLYALLSQIMRPEIKIFTIEDPVEYKLDDAVQLQVNPDLEFNFANALRSVLRQDPDVILVGEIRDQETAEIAIRASLTGHLVLATLHTNSAVEAITRLRDMGLDSFLLAATIRGIVAQRLLRTVCPTCAGAIELEKFCADCGSTGFLGRTVCYEILPVSKDFAANISSGQSSSALIAQAKKSGFVTLAEHAKSIVTSGKSTRSEVSRVIDLEGF